MKLSQLVSFLAVVEHKSIRGAARALGVTQPGITKTMRDLETVLEVPLVNRLSGGIDLTEFGELLRIRATYLLHEVQRTKDSLLYLRDCNTGQVAMGVSATAAHTLLPAALEQFMAESSAVEISVKEGPLSVFSPSLRDGTLDFVIANLPVDFADEEFEITPLFRFENVIGVRGSLAGLEFSNLEQLRQHPWIVPGPDARTGEHELIRSLFAAHQVETPKRIIRCESLATGLRMMVNSDLIGLFTKPLADLEFQRLGLKTVTLTENIPSGLLALVSSKHLQRSLAAARLVALLTLNASRFKREETEVAQGKINTAQLRVSK